MATKRHEKAQKTAAQNFVAACEQFPLLQCKAPNSRLAKNFKLAVHGLVLFLVRDELLFVHTLCETSKGLCRPQDVREIRAILRHKSVWRSKESLGGDRGSDSARWPTGSRGPPGVQKSQPVS